MNHINLSSINIEVLMFIILTYDVNKKRVHRIMKICRKYLIHAQKSVFEGLISDSKLNKLKKEITSSIDCNYDSVCIYKFGSLRYTEKEQIGIITDYNNIL